MTTVELSEIIQDKIALLGFYTCRQKNSFLFDLKAMYGETFDLEEAERIYESIYKEHLEKENK